MRLTIESADSIERVLAVVGALYQVEVAVQSTPSAPVEEAPPVVEEPTPVVARPSRRRGGTPRTSTRTAKVSAEVPATSADSAAIRAWARENGVAVSPRGRIPGTVQQAYDAAQV